MRPRVSLCLIVKNEEANLPACLDCAADLVDEVIVVDTGSTDSTRDVAAQRGARVFEFPWIDDFAAARNETLRHATGQWIFWLDADDRLEEANRRRLRSLLDGLTDDNAAFVMKCLCLSTEKGRSVSIFDHVRLFRNQPGVTWEYRIHEQVRPSLERLHYAIHASDVEILHVGYEDPALNRNKCERNLRLLRLEETNRPDDAFVLFNLACTLHWIDRLGEAQNYYRRCLALARAEQPAYMHKLYAMLTKACRQLGQTGEAIAVCREGRTLYPEDAELLTQEAWLLYLLGDYAGVETRLLYLLEPRKKTGTESYYGEDPGLRGHLTRHNLAVLYRDQQRFVEAEAQWRAVLAEQSDFTDARLGLGELYLGQQRWQEMADVLAQLQADPRTTAQAAVLLAQKYLALQEFDAARKLMDETIAANPRTLGPRIVLARVLLAQGSDRDASEKALRDVLALDPNNVEARQNLVLLQQLRG
jgi:glycosyltransferase involved in cell wall biosynthesis